MGLVFGIIVLLIILLKCGADNASLSQIRKTNKENLEDQVKRWKELSNKYVDGVYEEKCKKEAFEEWRTLDGEKAVYLKLEEIMGESPAINMVKLILMLRERKIPCRCLQEGISNTIGASGTVCYKDKENESFFKFIKYYNEQLIERDMDELYYQSPENLRDLIKVSDINEAPKYGKYLWADTFSQGKYSYGINLFNWQA